MKPDALVLPPDEEWGFDGEDDRKVLIPATKRSGAEKVTKLSPVGLVPRDQDRLRSNNYDVIADRTRDSGSESTDTLIPLPIYISMIVAQMNPENRPPLSILTSTPVPNRVALEPEDELTKLDFDTPNRDENINGDNSGNRRVRWTGVPF